MNQPNTDTNGVPPTTFDDEIAAWVRDASYVYQANPQCIEQAAALMRRARHVPEAASAGVVVPERVRVWATRTDVATADNDCPFPSVDDDVATAKWILSLPAAPQPEPALSESCKAPSGQCVMVASTDGSWCPAGCVPATGRYSWRNARGVLAAPQPPERSAAQALSEALRDCDIAYASNNRVSTILRALLARLGGEGQGGQAS